MLRDGDYYINYETGRVVVKTLSSGHGNVRYVVRKIPFTVEASPIFLVDFKNEKFKREIFQQIVLFNNKVTIIPSEIGQLTNLQKIDLSNNKITIIPPEIGQLTNLQKLYLSCNGITMIPPEIFQLTNLLKLELFGNQIQLIPPKYKN